MSEAPWYDGINISFEACPDGTWALFCKYDGIEADPFRCGDAYYDERFASLFASAPSTAKERDELKAEVETMKGTIAALCGAVYTAAVKFREYEALHAAKPDMDKAQRNADMASFLEDALKYADERTLSTDKVQS